MKLHILSLILVRLTEFHFPDRDNTQKKEKFMIEVVY